MRIEDEIKGKFRNNYHKAIINIIFTTNQINSEFLKLIKSFGLTSQQYNILRILRGALPVHCSLNYIKSRMLDRRSDVSRIVDRLFKKKLVIREEGKKDRREKDISITETGMTVLSDMDKFEKKVDKLLKNLSNSEVDQLNILLDKIRE